MVQFLPFETQTYVKACSRFIEIIVFALLSNKEDMEPAKCQWKIFYKAKISYPFVKKDNLVINVFYLLLLCLRHVGAGSIMLLGDSRKSKVIILFSKFICDYWSDFVQLWHRCPPGWVVVSPRWASSGLYQYHWLSRKCEQITLSTEFLCKYWSDSVHIWQIFPRVDSCASYISITWAVSLSGIRPNMWTNSFAVFISL